MIDIHNLHFRYRRKTVFAGLSLKVFPGHIYGLLGRNGTGKSTFLRTLAGLLRPNAGTIAVAGFHPFDRQPAFLQRVFLVPEEFYLPDVSVDKYIRCNSPFYATFDHSLMRTYLREFEIPAEQSLQQMSYGQKKKVLISFALACNTDLLLMDEPTNGLDIISKSQFRKVISAASHPGRCILISTHQVRDLENLIDRVMIIDDGRILFDETIDAINARLTCKISYSADEVARALYAESSVHGQAILLPHDGEDEGGVDLETLYKAIVTNGESVRSVFVTPHNKQS